MVVQFLLLEGCQGDSSDLFPISSNQGFWNSHELPKAREFYQKKQKSIGPKELQKTSFLGGRWR